MKLIPRKINIQKRVLVGSAIALLLTVSTASLYLLGAGGNLFSDTSITSSSQPTDGEFSQSQDTSPPTNEEVDTGTQIKQDSVDRDPQADEKTVNVTVTAIEAGELVRVRSIINPVFTGGSCKLTMSMGATVITRQAGVQALSSYSTCKGFDIPLSELSRGTWTATVSFSSGSSSGSGVAKVVIQ